MSPAQAAPAAVPRRERARAATIEEIKATALDLMREQHTTDVRFTDIARVMGMTPPALYRYFADRDELLTDAHHRRLRRPRRRGSPPSRDAGVRVGHRRPLARRRQAYRAWARSEPEQFALILGMPVPGYAADEEAPRPRPPRRAMSQLSVLFVDAAQRGQLGRPLIRDVDDVDADLRRRQAPRARRRRAARELPGDAAGLGVSARLHLAGGLRPPRLARRPEARDALFLSQVRLIAKTSGLPAIP